MNAAPDLPRASVLYNGESTAANQGQFLFRQSLERRKSARRISPFLHSRNLRSMTSREYPERPLVGVGGVVIVENRVLLVRRGTEPLLGEWSIPGGLLEPGETLIEGVARELLEETGLTVRVLGLIEALERIFHDQRIPQAPLTGDLGGALPAEAGKPPEAESAAGAVPGEKPPRRPRYHYVILDYLCERVSGELRPASDVTDAIFVAE